MLVLVLSPALSQQLAVIHGSLAADRLGYTMLPHWAAVLSLAWQPPRLMPLVQLAAQHRLKAAPLLYINSSSTRQAQMVRRVKAYLKSIKVITDEDALHKMSLECEPPSGGLSHPPPALAQVRHVATSPTPPDSP